MSNKINLSTQISPASQKYEMDEQKEKRPVSSTSAKAAATVITISPAVNASQPVPDPSADSEEPLVPAEKQQEAASVGVKSQSEKPIPVKRNKDGSDERSTESSLHIINVDGLKLPIEQLHKLQQEYNKKLSNKMPSSQSHSKIYVCNNRLFDHMTVNPYIVVKEVNKTQLEIGELSECRTDIKVHSYLSQKNLSVIHLFAWFESDTVFAAVYDYAQNGDLLEALNNLDNPYSPQWFFKARQEMKGIADTVAYMHRKGWPHKDLTLENILVDKHRRFYLHDFALVEEFDVVGNPKRRDEEATENDSDHENASDHSSTHRKRRRSYIWSGKIEHMSPENYATYTGQAKTFDPFANDVWGLGIILMCCFSTESFLWSEPDVNKRKYADVIKNLETRLMQAFGIEKQRNERIKQSLLHLIDLLKQIFVAEEHRLKMRQVLQHPFFQGISSDHDEADGDDDTCKQMMCRERACPSCAIL